MQQLRRPEGGQGGDITLRSQWESFHGQGAIAAGVRPEIAASWQRSARARLGPALPGAPVDEAALRGYEHAGPTRQRFRHAAETVADRLVTELGDATAAVVVCDDFGMVLYRAGRPQVLRTVDRVNLVPGGLWSERGAGTTGIGLALATGETAHVYAAEHFAEALHGFGCTATIVHQPVTGEALGVLGLATAASIPASFARPLVVRAAREIERRLDEELLGRERRLMEHHLRARAGSLLSVDRAGRTVIQSARLIQETSGEDLTLLMDLARSALRAESDLTEELELSRGRTRAETRLLRDGTETLGALVSLQRLAPRRRRTLAPGEPTDFSPLVGRSPAMRLLFREAARVVGERSPVLIRGEPGSGKLTIARRMHELGGGGPLTVVHCALAGWEEELARAGARPGTAVLRRVHALSPAAQLSLCDRLDAFEESEASPWIIALLNTDAPAPCPELSIRLSRITLTVPALRDRGHDLRRLVDVWCDARGASAVRPTVRADAYEALTAQPWPGNVRELHNVLAAAALRGGAVIGVEALGLADQPSGVGPYEPAKLRDLERAAIDTALRRTGGNVSRAARDLGIGRATLHRRLRAYRLLDG